MNIQILSECVSIIKDLMGHEPLFFDEAVEVKTSPHTYPFVMWAVCVSPKDELYLMDGEQQWHLLEPTDNNAALVVGSLYQRLRLMRIQYAKAS